MLPSTNPPERYEVMDPLARPRLLQWIASRGGVAVWVRRTNGGPPTDQRMGPALTLRGEAMAPPDGDYQLQEVVQETGRFRFLEGWEQAARFKVRLRKQGEALVLREGSRIRLEREMAAAGHKACYVFDRSTQEAVVLRPTWSD